MRPENVTVANGICTIKVEKRPCQNQSFGGYNVSGTSQYASGCITTFNKFTQTYGYFEARIQTSSCKGAWPAFWLLPDRGPAYGPAQPDNIGQRSWMTLTGQPIGNEIDVLESFGSWKRADGTARAHEGFIWDYNGGSFSDYSRINGLGDFYYFPNPDTAWHTYGVYWANGALTYYIDDQIVGYWTSANVAGCPEYMILNCALQTDDWQPGPDVTLAEIDAGLPSSVKIDWVHVYSGTATSPVPFTSTFVGRDLNNGSPMTSGTDTWTTPYTAATINAAGIWGMGDPDGDWGRITFKSMVGDGSIVARVTRIDDVGQSNASAGLIIREDANYRSKSAYIFTCPTYGSHGMKVRTTTTGTTTGTSTLGQSLPVWMKLVRSGTTFTGYFSADGTNWGTPVYTAGISMSPTVQIGLATSSRSANLTTAMYDNITITTASSGTGNLAQNRPVVASSQESSSYTPNLAVDGSGTTRWSSSFSDNQWIYVDLGQTTSISRVKLSWELAYATGYKIQVSNDATNWTDIYTTSTGNGNTDDNTGLSGSGRYVRVLCVTRATGFGISLFEFEVYGPALPPPANLALNKTAVASSQESSTYSPDKSVDGNGATRWASSMADNQWIYLDLGATTSFSRVKLTWEAAYASGYKIQVSNDATNWTDVYTTSTGNGGVDDLTGLSGSGRYVRMLGVTRGTSWGFSLFEFEIYQ